MQATIDPARLGDIFNALPDAHLLVDSKGKVTRYIGGAAGDETLAPAKLEGVILTEAWPSAAASKVVQAIRRVGKTRAEHAVHIELDSERYEARVSPKGRNEHLLLIRRLSGGSDLPDSVGDRGRVDDVTGLTTRDRFMEVLDDSLAEAGLRERGAAVLCLDINNFTRINDSLGRSVGDAVLQVTAKRIERCLRDYDHLARIDDSSNSNHLTRISGDEFVLLLNDVESRKDASTVADRLGDAFVEPVTIQGHQVAVSPCIGIAQFPVDGEDAETLVQNARTALGEAKLSADRGKAFFSNTMKFRAVRKLDVSTELRWAIDNDQLEIRYLPRIDLASGHVAGVEALLRWIHPLRGNVPLREVIPLAEATGLMIEIGEWVLDTVTRQGQSWASDFDEAPPVSVNVGESEFKRDDLVEVICRTLESSKLPHAQLEIEVAEKLLCRSPRAETTVRSLDELGVGVMIDDFGSSWSSIGHLTELPVKGIKIDRSFVSGARESGSSQNTCAAIIAMAQKLGMTVIAEGVENGLQAEFLRDHGCDAVQGFLYTQPLQAADVPAFIESCASAASESLVVDLTTMRMKINAKSVS